MHILFLSDNFPPEVNAPASRTFEHCREWVRAGHRVTLITCAPNFPKGAVFEGYKNRLWQSEEIEGIRVIRVWTYITANEGFAKRILDYMSFMLTAFLASFLVRKVDIVIGTSPQFFTVCAAYATSIFKRVPWVFELRDIWPESIRAVGAVKSSRVLDFLEKVEMFLYRRADLIISVTNSFRDTLIRRGVDADKIKVITNGVDMSRFQPRGKDAELLRTHDLQGKIVAGYIGTHGMAHALETLLDAAQMISQQPGGERYRFLFLGDGANKKALVERARSQGLDNVLFVDSVPKDDVVRYWSLLDVSIIHLKKTELFTTVIPSKMFECMAMAIPVAHGVQGESARILEHEKTGVTFEPENAEALCAVLKQLQDNATLYEHMKLRGPVAAKNYDRKALAMDMLRHIEQLTESPARLVAEE